ncbi:helicase-related protein [Aliamphritea spongicola]|nr:helicase-related protein [Aliamphritea spongicola]
MLIATEVAARGLDIQGLEHVVNFNLPYLAEDYVHRVGRAGRAGMPGKAISFVSREEERTLNDIEHLIGSRIKRVYMEGFEVSKREGLKKYLKKARKAPRSNKVTRTKIVKSAGAGKKNRLSGSNCRY